MTPHDHAQMLLGKAAQDEALLDSILEDETVSPEIFGYHSQQAAEKLLKAWLAQRAVHYPKTHNLQTLVELLEAQGQPLPADLADLGQLTPYATVYRYEQVPEYTALDRKAARTLIVNATQKCRAAAILPLRLGRGECWGEESLSHLREVLPLRLERGAGRCPSPANP